MHTTLFRIHPPSLLHEVSNIHTLLFLKCQYKTIFSKDCFHIDEGAQLQGVFKREKLNKSVSCKSVIPSNYIKTVLYKIFMYDSN